MRLILALLICAASVNAADVFTSSDQGFTLQLPALANFGRVALFTMATKHGFAANINLLIQPATDLTAYNETTLKSFKDALFKVVDSKMTDDSITYEYTGPAGGRQLHWYAIAHLKNDKIYLITATALEDDWAEQKNALMRSVNSFKFNK